MLMDSWCFLAALMKEDQAFFAVDVLVVASDERCGEEGRVEDVEIGAEVTGLV